MAGPAASLPKVAVQAPQTRSVPALSTCLELLKPITWFPPMWAFGCGIVSTGLPLQGHWMMVAAGLLVAGPLVCGTSQAANDWYDRAVDAINEPQRPIPSGRMPGAWGLYVAVGWTLFSLLVATSLGRWGFAAACCGLLLAWVYSAPPVRLKRNGWWGNAAVGLCYEGLPWFTAAAVMSVACPSWPVIAVAVLYSVGAHGIMTLNDFKSIQGDRQMGIGSLPARLGADRAASLACAVMGVPQAGVVMLLLWWGRPCYAVAILLLLGAQLLLMQHLLQSPRARAVWYCANGVGLFVIGMLVTAFALHGVVL